MGKQNTAVRLISRKEAMSKYNRGQSFFQMKEKEGVITPIKESHYSPVHYDENQVIKLLQDLYEKEKTKLENRYQSIK